MANRPRADIPMLHHDENLTREANRAKDALAAGMCVRCWEPRGDSPSACHCVRCMAKVRAYTKARYVPTGRPPGRPRMAAK